jgi:hypothetical protein
VCSRTRASSRVSCTAARVVTRASYSRCMEAMTAQATDVALSSFLFAVAVTYCSSTERLEVLLGMVDMMVEVRGAGGGRR